MLTLLWWCFCSWRWLYNAIDWGKDVKAAPLPTEESTRSELTEGTDTDDVEEEESGKEKKKRTGFRDRKVM